MPSPTTHLFQRIPEGLALLLQIERETAWIEDGTERRTQFPVSTRNSTLVEGAYDITLEVAQGGRFLHAEEIAARPLKSWLTCPEVAVRLVLNRDPQGGPLTTAPFDLEGIEVAVRPTFSIDPKDHAWRMACLLPCQEVRVYTRATGQAWRVNNLVRRERRPAVQSPEEKDPPSIRDHFSDLAAALPTRPSARPYGSPGAGTAKQWEDLEGFRMGMDRSNRKEKTE